MLPADLAAVATPALTPWGMYLAADVGGKSVMIALALASLATWTVLLAKGCELARAPSLPGERAASSWWPHRWPVPVSLFLRGR